MFVLFNKSWAEPTFVGPSDDYVFGDETSVGEKRLVEPLQIAGEDRALFRRYIENCESFDRRTIASASLNFAECPDDDQLRVITEDLFDFSYAGIDIQRRLYIAGRHHKLLRATRARSADVHPMWAPTLLGGSQPVFRPYVPKADFYGYYIWAERWNYRLALASPFDPDRYRTTAPRAFPSDGRSAVALKLELGLVLRKAWGAGTLERPEDVLQEIRSFPGNVSAQHDGRSIVAHFTQCPKPVRLAGRVFRPNFDADRLRVELSRLRRLPSEEVEDEYERILALRANRHFARYGTPTVRWTYAYLQRFNLAPTINQYEIHPPPDLTHWQPALELEDRVGSAADRLGTQCRQIERAIELITESALDCFEQTEPIGAGCPGTEDPTRRLREGAEQLHRHHEDTRILLSERDRSTRKAGDKTDLGRSFAQQADAFIHTFRLFADLVPELPRTEELERALFAISSGQSVPERMRRWLLDNGRLVRPEVIDWLTVVDRDGLKLIEPAIRLLEEAARDPEVNFSHSIRRDQDRV